MSDWAQWKRDNADKIKGYENDFVDLVISHIPEISPSDVVPQYHFPDPRGSNRYIDFMIINPTKGYLLPIELDGKDKKPNGRHEDWNDFLARQNALIRSFRTVLLRFSNNQMRYDARSIIDAISKELLIQAADKSRNDRLRQALVGFGTLSEPVPLPSAEVIQRPHSGRSIGWPAVAACAAVVGAGILGYSNLRNEPPRYSAGWKATASPLSIPNAPSDGLRLAEAQIEALKAPFHVGESVLACGKVAQVTERNEVTYVNLDHPYPNQSLALVIWRNDLASYEGRFGSVTALEGKRVCALGTIDDYRRNLQIVMKNPQFLRVMTK